MKNYPWWVHPLLLTTALIYGGNYSIAKSVMPEPLPPFGFILLRIAGSGVLFWLMHLFFIKEAIQHKRDYARLALCALFGAAINMLLFFDGLSLTSPVNASLIMTTTPIVVVIAAYLLLKERITRRKSLGLALGFGGAVSLIGLHELSWSNSLLLGDLMIMGNAAAYAIYLVLVKPLMARYHAVTVNLWVFFFGGIFVLPFTFQQAAAIPFGTLTMLQWGSIAFVVLLTTFFAYLVNASVLKYASSSLVGYYTFLQPVFATLIEVLAGREVPTVGKLVSAFLIFAGVYLVSVRR